MTALYVAAGAAVAVQPALALLVLRLVLVEQAVEVLDDIAADLHAVALTVMPDPDAHDDVSTEELDAIFGPAVGAPSEADQLAAELANLDAREEALSQAIAWTWARLTEAGATHRGHTRRAVSTPDAEGNDSEGAIRELWVELRTLGSQRRAVRREARDLGEQLAGATTITRHTVAAAA